MWGCGQSTTRPPKSSPAPATQRPYKVLGKWYRPIATADGFRERGLASWYGKKFHGRKTSNGERYDMYGISAAHKTLPIGTWVRVHNLENGKTLDVRINDRGPFVRDRIIDLSYGAAKVLGVAAPGTAPVEIVALGKAVESQSGDTVTERTYQPVDYLRGNFTFQVGAFTSIDNARQLQAQLDQKYMNVHLVKHDDGVQTYYRVRLGRATNLDKAIEYEQYLVQNGFPGVITIAE
jgi:rare lipoprotein A